MISRIRNFSIIAHIDHGKTTLTDQLLLSAGNLTPNQFHERMLDSNPIEQERGITIKLAPVRLNYRFQNLDYQLNLIDTPGHVDFSYEVSRSLSACEGAILLVDATKGVQAQTIANYDKALAQGLTIIPVINKIDLPNADIQKVTHELQSFFGFSPKEIIQVSAKTGYNIDQLFQAIISRIPAPKPPSNHALKALIFNSTFHPHKGVIAFIRLFSGKINPQNLNQLLLYQNHQSLSPLEIGFFNPQMQPTQQLTAGQVGYLATGLKDIHLVQVGDTLTERHAHIQPIKGYRKPKPMVYMDLYPLDAKDYGLLVKALAKLALNDAALTYKSTASPALGHGFRVGFLGILHAEIVNERLRREFQLDVINTSPSVPYRLILNNGQIKTISSPTEFPDPSSIKTIQEPIVNLTIYTPKTYLGSIMELCESKRAVFQDMQYLNNRVKLQYTFPLIELIINFYDRLKSISSGYASIQYEHAGYQSIDAVKVDILLNHKPVPAFSFIAPKSTAEIQARALVNKLKDLIPRQQFELPIQAAIGGRIIARQTLKAFRKDVTAKLYGGDRTRRLKLLEKQKRGKKRMKQLGSVNLPPEVFTAVLKLDTF